MATAYNPATSQAANFNTPVATAATPVQPAATQQSQGAYQPAASPLPSPPAPTSYQQAAPQQQAYQPPTQQGAYQAPQGAYQPPQGAYQAQSPPPQGAYQQSPPPQAAYPSPPLPGQSPAPQQAYQPQTYTAAPQIYSPVSQQTSTPAPGQRQSTPPAPNAAYPTPPADGQQKQPFQNPPLQQVPGTTSAQGQPQGQVPAAAGGLQGGIAKVSGELTKHGGKYGAWVGNQLQIQGEALKTVAAVGDINSHGQPVEYHVHKAGGLFSKDDVVTGQDRNSPLYYLDFPRTWRASWNLTLHKGDRTAPILATLTKGSYGFTSNDIEICMANGWKTILAKPSIITKTHVFTGFDGVTKFSWKSDGLLASTMSCIDNTDGSVACTWTHSYAIGKDGTLLVSPKYMQMIDLLVPAALAMEEWRREESEKGGGSSTSPLNLAKGGLAMLGKFGIKK